MTEIKCVSNVRVRELIETSQKTRSEIGDRIGVDASTVTKYCNGDRKLTKEQIDFYIGKNSVPADYLPEIINILKTEECREAMYIMTKVFMYGIIIGKQQDRARRKKSGVNA